jgi:protein-tyrosine-phosphatase
MLANLKANRSNPLLLTQPRFRSFLEWLRPLAGKESWDYFDWRDKRITAGMLAAAWGRYAGATVRRLTRGARAASLKRRHGRTVANSARAGHPPRRLLFLCYGNICRSPFAHLAAARMLPECVVESAGFHPVEHRSTPADVAAAAQELGIDLSAHRSARVTQAQVARADLIVLMDQANYSLLTSHFPEAAGRVVMLGMFGTPSALEIQDPYQQDAATIHRVLGQIVRSVEGLAAWIGKSKKDSC